VALIKRGITKSDTFCTYSPNSIQYCVLQFASYFLGSTLMPLSLTLAVYEMRKDIANLESVVIFTSVENAKYFDEIINDFNNNENQKPKVKSVFIMNGNYDNYIPFEKLLEEGKNQILDRIPHFDIDPKTDIFLLLRSSGTSGLPKITIISHHNFVASLTLTLSSRRSNGLVVSVPFPTGHIGIQISLPSSIGSGATIIIYEKFDEELLLQSVEKYRVNVLPLFPAVGHKLIKGKLVDKYDLSSVKVMFTGGAAFPGNVAKEIVKKYNVIFREGMKF
jgi:fatty-acyl-CoA synthase